MAPTQAIARLVFSTFIHSKALSEIEILKDSIVGILDSGKIAFVTSRTEENLAEIKKQWDCENSAFEYIEEPNFVVPGFIDTHIHAPQFSFTGTGYDLQLLDWLNKYTFPTESKLSDSQIAEQVYSRVIQSTLQNGTTTAAYFATINLQTTQLLVELLYKQGQRALVGKVNMDRNSPKTYSETTRDSFEETEKFILFCKERFESEQKSTKSAVEIVPIITPRFVPSCTSKLMSQLGQLAKKYDVPIQSHISENKNEVAWVKELHPDCSSYTDVYDKHGLLNEKTIMAHGVHLTDEELKIFKERKTGISHCPVSNFALNSGILPVRKVLASGVKLGLGTDVSGGYSTSMLEVMRQAIIGSSSIYFNDPSSTPLTFKEAFYLATLGSAEVINMRDLLGSFAPGKYFDALVIDPTKSSLFSTTDFVANSLEDVFQKFIFLGNSSNITKVYVQGTERLKQ